MPAGFPKKKYPEMYGIVNGAVPIIDTDKYLVTNGDSIPGVPDQTPVEDLPEIIAKSAEDASFLYKLPPPPEDALGEYPNFNQLLGSYRDLRKWCDRLFFELNRLETLSDDAMKSTQQAIRHTSEIEAQYQHDSAYVAELARNYVQLVDRVNIMGGILSGILYPEKKKKGKKRDR